jgi:hypothetical protein
MADDYVDAEVRRVLAEDAGIAELGIEVIAHADRIVLRGQVESPERRDAIGRRVAGYLPDHRVHNDIVVIETDPPDHAEELP